MHVAGFAGMAITVCSHFVHSPFDFDCTECIKIALEFAIKIVVKAHKDCLECLWNTVKKANKKAWKDQGNVGFWVFELLEHQASRLFRLFSHYCDVFKLGFPGNVFEPAFSLKVGKTRLTRFLRYCFRIRRTMKVWLNQATQTF